VGDVVRAEYSGSSITIYINDVSSLSTTDSALSTNTKHGFGGSFWKDSVTKFDNLRIWV
jgi:hypothetical protein